MNNLMKNLLRVFNGLLGGLLVLVGFAGCEKETPLEYGAPHADYVIKGKVLMASQDEPLAGIQVEIDSYLDFEYPVKDTVLTNSMGEFLWRKNTVDRLPEIRLIASVPDVPAEEAKFLPDTVVVSLKDIEFTGGKGWYEGRAEVEQNITMKNNPNVKE